MHAHMSAAVHDQHRIRKIIVNYTALATAVIICCCMYFIYEGKSVIAELLSESGVVCSIRYKAQWAGAPDTKNMPNYG